MKTERADDIVVLTAQGLECLGIKDQIMTIRRRKNPAPDVCSHCGNEDPEKWIDHTMLWECDQCGDQEQKDLDIEDCSSSIY